jgi:hypothetical protein
MQLESGILVAVLVAAVLLHDRLGGKNEAALRLYQAGLAISLVFLAVSGTTAFIRPDLSDQSSIIGSSGSSDEGTDAANRTAAATTVDYAVGVGLLVAGLATRRRYRTIPLGVILGGVLLILIGASLGGLTGYDLLLRISLSSSRSIDVVTFIAACAGTGALLWYGTQLETESAVSDDEDVGAEGGGVAGD